MTFSRGQLIANRFRLINPIGRGALGELWRAVDRVPDRQIAIRRVGRFEPLAVRRMLDEVDASRALRERCVARVHRAGMFDDGTGFIATELLVSESLDELLARRRVIPPGAALTLVAELAAALAQAHERKLAHGAISPGAILLHRDERGAVTPKLTDFGRVALLGSADGYASPEQLGDEPGARYASDVWALGVLLFRCVTGEQPFCRRTDPFEAQRIVRDADLPDPIRNTLYGALEPDREARVTAAELAVTAQLAAWRARGGFVDLEKMVRIDPGLWLDPEATGAVTHCPTIPALGGAPPPRPTEPPTELFEAAEMSDDVEEVDEAWVSEPAAPPPPLPVVAPAPIAVQRPLSAPEPAPIAEPARYPTPIPDEVFVDFRPKHPRGRVYAACAGAAAIALVSIAALSSTTPRRARVRTTTNNAHAKVVERPAPKPVTAAIATAVVRHEPTAQPKVAVAMVTAAAKPPETRAEKRAEKKAEKKAETKSASKYPVVGVPLWDPPVPVAKPKAPVDDNPYN